MKSATENKLNILIYNTDLPIFPGSGAHEFLNTTHLAQWTNQLGLVSMAHTLTDEDHAKTLINHQITPYLWKGPRSPAVSTKSSLAFLKKSLRTAYTALIHCFQRFCNGFLNQPDDLLVSNNLFRCLSKPLLQAFSAAHWHVFIVIQSSAARVIDYVPSNTTSVLVMHDIRSLVYARQAAIVKSWWKKKYLNRQAKRYFYFEKEYSKKFDLIITLSPDDAAWIQKNYHPRRVAVVPIPVDTQYFIPPARDITMANRIVFTGHMSHPPNIDAAIFFAKDILPRIRKIIPQAEFYIVGKSPTAAVLALAHLPGVQVTGTVPDTRAFLAEASVVVVPLRFGSGVRNKILEAWGMQKCIVSTTLGAEGLAYHDGLHLKIADDADTMAAAVIQALRDPSYRHQLSLQGREIAIQQHHPQRIGQHYFQEINHAVQEKWQQCAPLRIAIDLRWMVPGLAGGIEHVARSFINELMKLQHTHHYILLLNPKCKADFATLQHPSIRLLYHHPTVKLKKYTQLLLGKMLSTLRVEHLQTREILDLRMAHGLQCDMVYSIPGYSRPEFYALTNILTIHDIQHEFFPHFFLEHELEERKRIFSDSIQHATHITAVSEFTRQTLITQLNVAPDKVTTILQAADPYFTAEKNPEDHRLLANYGLSPDNYLFFPAHTWHHKNHQAAIHALAILHKKYRIKIQLVCTGGKREAQTSIEQTIQTLGLSEQVHFLGYVPRHVIPALYRSAIALVYPSLFEGFGLPVLEAMQSGCPVICSHTTSLPEIAGQAALFVDLKTMKHWLMLFIK